MALTLKQTEPSADFQGLASLWFYTTLSPIFWGGLCHMTFRIFPCAVIGEEPACKCRRHGFNPWVGGRSPGGGNGNPLPYPFHGKLRGQRSLVGYSPWGHQRRTQLSVCVCVYTHTHTHLSGS